MKVRYLIKFTKEADIKFLAHLDLMRTIQRIVRRADLPASYSKGFNPHMSLSLAQPLPVGVYSIGDYMDLDLDFEVASDEIINRLNAASPLGIRFLAAVPIRNLGEKKLPQAMALLEAARYTIKIKAKDNNIVDKVNTLLAQDSYIAVKKGKKGEKTIDMKPMIKEIKYWLKENTLVFKLLLSCGSRENLSPELLAGYIADNTDGICKDDFIEIYREEMYTIKDGRLVSLINYVS